VVVQKAYDWALWIIPKVEKFPKSYRFSIGQSLVTASIELLMDLVDASYQTRNAGSLGAAVREVNRIRYPAMNSPPRRWTKWGGWREGG
jgi:hypothetical protein